MRDVRYALRGLGRSPGFTAAVVLIVGLGIGATTAIYTVGNGVILRPLPFAHPERLVQMFGSTPLYPRADAVSNLDEYRRQSTSSTCSPGMKCRRGICATPRARSA